jgi:hypothetical protein
MKMKNSIINTFNRIGLDYKSFIGEPYDSMKVEARNWLTGVSCQVHPLIRECIEWVYRTQLAYEKGDMGCRQDDFDRVRYFILEVDSEAYNTCID